MVSAYFKENYNSKVITDGKTYFIIYDIYDDESLYLRHLYISPESRGKRSIKRVEEELIEAENPEYLFCKLEKSNKNWSRMAYAFMKRQGYQILDENDSEVRLYRKLR